MFNAGLMYISDVRKPDHYNQFLAFCSKTYDNSGHKLPLLVFYINLPLIMQQVLTIV